MENSPRKEPYLYLFNEHLGGGGFGDVYKAKDIFDEIDGIAIKVLRPDELNQDGIDRFNREIRIHSKLKHKNVVSIIDFSLDDSIAGDEEKGVAYYTMPLGKSNFRTFMNEFRQNNVGKMDDETAVFYFNQILDGIEYAHSEGIIHRDLKPENIIFFEENGEEVLKIADFGLGKFLNSNATLLTQSRMALGTDAYAPPEQRENSRDVKEEADIFALGKILYEMLTYDIPHSVDFEKIQNSKLKFIIRKATNHNKDRRYKSIKELRDQLNVIMGNTGTAKNLSVQFNELYKSYMNEYEEEKLKEICDLLLKHNADYILYTEDFMRLDEATLTLMDLNHKDEFYDVLQNYFSIADGSHIYSFTDKICDFIFDRLFECISHNMDLYEKAFETVLSVGYNHNRFHIARRFARAIEDISDEEVEYKMIVGEVLANNQKASSWVRYYVHEHQLCDYLSKEIEKY